MREGWVETKLVDAVEVLDRFRKPINSTEREGRQGSVPYYGANGQAGWINDSIFNEELVLLGEDAIDFADPNARKAYLISGPSWVNNHAHVLRAKPEKVYSYFLAESLNKVDYSQYVSFGTRSKLTQGSMNGIKVLLPPLPEQKRIVDLVSSVDSYIEALQRQLESAKGSRNAVLHELLTAGGADWVETTLGEVTQINPEQARDFDSERLIKYVDLSTVTFDNGIDSEIDPIPFDEAPGRARRIVRENDVIVATVRPYLKGFAFVNKDFNEQIASTGFCVIRAESELILPELVWALVGSDDFVDFLIRRSTGSSYPAVRPIDISEFNFMLPPFKDQETVSQLIRTFDQLIKDSTNLINSTQNLRSGLLSDLLSGEHEMPASYDRVIGAA